jgi:prepilin-type N-terminal cleavage/methylation domain-containing protein
MNSNNAKRSKLMPATGSNLMLRIISKKPQRKYAFTLVEILIVVVILSIAAMTAIPMMSNAASLQLRSAENLAASDLEYARNLSISTGKNYTVAFEENNEKYYIKDDSGAVIDHPVSKGQNYSVDFTIGQLKKVAISSADFDGTNQVSFDYLGTPYNGNGTAMTDGHLILEADGMQTTITVEPLTGYISID